MEIRIIERKKDRNRNRVFIVGTILFVISAVSWVMAQDAKLYNKGKKFVYERQWDKAIETYNRLLNEYPGGLYNDYAQFYIGFSLEQVHGREREAFEKYQRVIENYPKSPWVDDAVIHQILIAKKFSLKGDASFKEFLRQKAADADSMIRYQAALALAELKDPTVLPTLVEMAKGQDETMARQAMDVLERYSKVLEESVEEEPEVAVQKVPVESFPTEKTWENLSEKLLKKGASWTEGDLLFNGLYHIVSQDELAFYLSLENEWDRREWWRKLWASKDPTPTTPKNEAEEEFKRRVLYARENFGRDWDATHFIYPPWDSRGEIYIKFGTPDRRERDKNDQGWEDWTYYKYRIVLLVSNHLSNRTGDGVRLNTISRYVHRRDIGFKGSVYLQDPRFLYSDPNLSEVNNIRGLDFRIGSTSRIGQTVRIEFVYVFSAWNLRFQTDKSENKGAYRTHWVVYDEDYRSVASSDAVEEVIFSEKDDLRKHKVSGHINVDLIPGSYRLALRIEDLKSERIGIYRKHFTVKNKGELQEMQEDKNETSNLMKGGD